MSATDDILRCIIHTSRSIINDDNNINYNICGYNSKITNNNI